MLTEDGEPPHALIPSRLKRIKLKLSKRADVPETNGKRRGLIAGSPRRYRVCSIP
jgi:hypothetical protein